MKKAKKKEPIKLELAFLELEKLKKFPWPWADQSVSEVKIVDVFHYIPAQDRGKFMDELYRVLVTGGQATIVTAYYSTALAYADYNLAWPPLCEQSFLYFNKGWRKANQIPWSLNCDFDFVYGYILTSEVAGRSQEVQSFQVKSYLNTVQRLQVTLTKRAEE